MGRDYATVFVMLTIPSKKQRQITKGALLSIHSVNRYIRVT